jgi:hypothetical protein
MRRENKLITEVAQYIQYSVRELLAAHHSLKFNVTIVSSVGGRNLILSAA